MEKTNLELWNEVLRTAVLMRSIESNLKPMQEAIFQQRPLAKNEFPVDYVSDAEILVGLILELKTRGASIS